MSRRGKQKKKKTMLNTNTFVRSAYSSGFTKLEITTTTKKEEKPDTKNVSQRIG